jgi:hypothetical protein
LLIGIAHEYWVTITIGEGGFRFCRELSKISDKQSSRFWFITWTVENVTQASRKSGSAKSILQALEDTEPAQSREPIGKRLIHFSLHAAQSIHNAYHHSETVGLITRL